MRMEMIIADKPYEVHEWQQVVEATYSLAEVPESFHKSNRD